VTSAAKASATHVTDAWAMPGFPTRTDGDAILGWPASQRGKEERRETATDGKPPTRW